MPCVEIDHQYIENTSLAEAADQLVVLACDQRPSLVVTTNIQHLRALRSDPGFQDAYAMARFRFADDWAVVGLSYLAGTPLQGRVTGADLEPELCRRLEELGGSVLYIGGTLAVNEAAIRNRQASYPGLRVAGYSPPIGFEASAEQSKIIVAIINEAARRGRPLAVFFCTGSPKSEKWLAQHMHLLEGGVMVPAGAAVDFAAGAKRRASPFLQHAKLEWLARVAQEPMRLGPRFAQDGVYAGRLALKMAIDGILPPAGRRVRGIIE